jgi:hypothetical protein
MNWKVTVPLSRLGLTMAIGTAVEVPIIFWLLIGGARAPSPARAA